MPDYKEMYLTLFRDTAKAISILQLAQQKTEEIYISDESSSEGIMILLNSNKTNENN